MAPLAGAERNNGRLRAAERNYYPTLLVFLLNVCVTASGVYSTMRHLPRLESEQKFGAIFRIFIIFRGPNVSYEREKTHNESHNGLDYS